MMEEKHNENVTLSAQEWKDFQARLNDVEEHRRGLLKHTQNLEHLVNEAIAHARHLEEILQQKNDDITRFIKHLANIEHLLKEKEKDLNQSKQLLEDYKARCYRYEQMLRDHGEEIIEGDDYGA